MRFIGFVPYCVILQTQYYLTVCYGYATAKVISNVTGNTTSHVLTLIVYVHHCVCPLCYVPCTAVHSLYVHHCVCPLFYVLPCTAVHSLQLLNNYYVEWQSATKVHIFDDKTSSKVYKAIGQHLRFSNTPGTYVPTSTYIHLHHHFLQYSLMNIVGGFLF